MFRLWTMKPYLRVKNTKFYCKIDCHPRRGWINWWEDRDNTIARSTMKQILKKEILHNMALY